MWKNQKHLLDERIEKESNRLSAKMFYLISILMVASIIAKLYYKVPLYVYTLELISLAVSGIFCIVSEWKHGILLLTKKDEALLSIHHKILAKAFTLSFEIIITGELLFLFVAKEYIKWLGLYLVIWGVPALLITYFSIKNGWFIWGTEKKEKDGKKELKKRTAMGALFFGVFMGFPMLFRGGMFHPEGLLWIFGMAAGWGIPFYLIFTGMMKIAERRADKNIVGKEPADEE
ncbi:MAG: hypothetical protein K6G30_07125 [Acetatifactor sp.]|nr:hypothetical protein [Acetatifactor sp.]